MHVCLCVCIGCGYVRTCEFVDLRCERECECECVCVGVVDIYLLPFSSCHFVPLVVVTHVDVLLVYIRIIRLLLYFILLLPFRLYYLIKNICPIFCKTIRTTHKRRKRIWICFITFVFIQST